MHENLKAEELQLKALLDWKLLLKNGSRLSMLFSDHLKVLQFVFYLFMIIIIILIIIINYFIYFS